MKLVKVGDPELLYADLSTPKLNVEFYFADEHSAPPHELRARTVIHTNKGPVVADYPAKEIYKNSAEILQLLKQVRDNALAKKGFIASE